jgi:16S rRNA (adenine1518-N6/adenine1519-N6)-dimethyltransferase
VFEAFAGDAFHARKRFGQNFLADRGVLRTIVERAGISPDDAVLEVGAGTGVLTRALLLGGCGHLFSVEADPRLKECLEALRAELGPRLSLVWGDAMKIDCGGFSPFPNKSVANLPYNITTPLIWRLLGLASRGMTYHLYMVQKEAADRLTAKRDTKDRYPLGVTLEVMGKVAFVRGVPRACFRPAPRVDSALVEIRLERNLRLTENLLWSGLLHAGFRQRRKKLSNNLKGFGGIENWLPFFEESALDPGVRAEDLSGDEWLGLYRRLGNADRAILLEGSGH